MLKWGQVLAISLLATLFAGPGFGDPAAAQELAKEQALVLALPIGDKATLDPVGGVASQDSPILHAIYGALVRYPIGDSMSPNFEPDLATKWDVSPDRLTWTFYLRRGVKCHWDYGELTSDDVVYSLNRVKNSPVSAYKSNYANFAAVKAVDRYTIQIKTMKPEPFLLNKVANYMGGWIACKKAIEKGSKFDKALSPTKEELVGTGPFKLLEYVPKDRIVLVRNDDYWEGKYVIEKVVYRYVPDDYAREAALLKGEIAAYQGMVDKKWLKYIKEKGMIVDPMGPIDLKALFLNYAVKPLDNKKVREAIAYATGQDAQVELQGEEVSRYCTSPVPSDTHGHIDAGWAHYKRDIEKARRLMAEAGFPNGFSLKLFMSSGPWYLDKMTIMQSQLKEINVQLDMTVVDQSVYNQKTAQDANPIVIRGMKLPLATYWLRNFFHSESIIGAPKGAMNYSHYANPEVDNLIQLAETTFDQKAQLDALAKAQRLIVEDLPAVPVVETLVPMVRNRWFDLGYRSTANFLWHYEVGPKTRILAH